MTTTEYQSPVRAVGRDAVFVRHRTRSPRVADSAYVAPTAVLCGDVTVGPHSRVLFGAVITAEGGPVEIGAHCIIMENAVIRGVPGCLTRLGDHVLVGPHASLTGCVIEGDTRIATGALVYNGARIAVGAELEAHSVVHVSTVVGEGVVVPTGWAAAGDPAELVPPGDVDRLRELMAPLDFSGTVFGVDREHRSMPEITRRYARALSLHSRDQVLPPDQHGRLGEGNGSPG